MAAAITVRVGRAGGRVHEVALNGNRTVNNALEAAGLTLKPSEVVYLNDEELDNDDLSTHDLSDGDKIILVKNLEGGKSL